MSLTQKEIVGPAEWKLLEGTLLSPDVFDSLLVSVYVYVSVCDCKCQEIWNLLNLLSLHFIVDFILNIFISFFTLAFFTCWKCLYQPSRQPVVHSLDRTTILYFIICYFYTSPYPHNPNTYPYKTSTSIHITDVHVYWIYWLFRNGRTDRKSWYEL